MSLTTFPTTRPSAVGTADAADRHRAELIEIHARAGVLIADLSPGPSQSAASALIVRLIDEAGQVIGDDRRPVALDVPAVVQCRELAIAQRRMVATLDRGDALATESAVVRGRALLAELTELAAQHRATLHR